METVNVLISTYNGEAYIEEQIMSIRKQLGVHVIIHVRDDGSKDSTPQLLQTYYDSKYIDKLELGTNIGYELSFMSLLKGSVKNVNYIAFSDQDDFWEPDKLHLATIMLNQNDKNIKLYFSSLTLVDSKLTELSKKKFTNIISFGSALTRHNAAGCTMVMSRDLVDIAKLYMRNDKVISHDAWVYLLCLWMGGEIINDKESHIKYRQHDNNVTSARHNIWKRIRTEFKNIKKNRLKRTVISELLVRDFSQYAKSENTQIAMKYLSFRNRKVSSVSMMCDKRYRFGRSIIDFYSRVLMVLNLY